jgi:dienelactone hydrolase
MKKRNDKFDCGTYQPLLEAVLKRSDHGLSFLSRDWEDASVWRAAAREKVRELMAFEPAKCPLRAKTLGRIKHDGLIIEKLSYKMPYGPDTEGYFLLPAKRGRGRRLPAVAALHDHGGFKYFGKEKIVGLPDEPLILKKFKAECYGGKSWANELAKRGYAVLVTDLFLWGSRKVAVDSLPPSLNMDILSKWPDTDEYIRAYNNFAGQHEHILSKSILTAGTTWPGIYAYEDRRSLDYLAARKEIDPERIGCCGLSGGGIRSLSGRFRIRPSFPCEACSSTRGSGTSSR